MTERLYLTDPYTSTFDVDILDARETPTGTALIFAKTYFYPESGGQPHDLGTIDGIPVVQVLETPEAEVLHVVERRPKGPRVHCEIDVERRLDHMQQHSGQHILSAAFIREVGAHTTSFHLGAACSTIDVDAAELSDAAVRGAVDAANAVVRAGASIGSRFVSGDEAQELDLRKAPPAGETLRIVTVDGFDEQACCGTHPRSSAEVGPIVVRGFERFKGGTRVEFLCGERALADYRVTVARLRGLAAVLSAPEAELVDTAQRFKDERKAMHKELEKLRGEALAAASESWMVEAKRVGSRQVLVKRIESLAPGALRTVALRLTRAPGRVVLLGSIADERAHLVFARSEDGDEDMGALLRACVDVVGGKGGGSKQVAQGGGPQTAGLERALEQAHRRLTDVS